MRSKIFAVKNALDKILQNEFDGRRLYNGLKPQDEIRLLILLQWQRRYKVTLSYILDAVLPHWLSRIAKWSKKRKPTKSLGVKVTTLVGKVSERLLQEEIAKDFPNQENVAEWFWARRRAILEQRDWDENEIPMRIKGPLDYDTVEDFVRNYKKRVAEEKELLDNATANRRNKRRRYRDSPWT